MAPTTWHNEGDLDMGQRIAAALSAALDKVAEKPDAMPLTRL